MSCESDLAGRPRARVDRICVRPCAEISAPHRQDRSWKEHQHIGDARTYPLLVSMTDKLYFRRCQACIHLFPRVSCQLTSESVILLVRTARTACLSLAWIQGSACAWPTRDSVSSLRSPSRGDFYFTSQTYARGEDGRSNLPCSLSTPTRTVEIIG